MNIEVDSSKIPSIMLLVHIVSRYKSQDQRNMLEGWLEDLEVNEKRRSANMVFFMLYEKIHVMDMTISLEISWKELELILFKKLYNKRSEIFDIFPEKNLTASIDAERCLKKIRTLFGEKDKKDALNKAVTEAQKQLKNISPYISITKPMTEIKNWYIKNRKRGIFPRYFLFPQNFMLI